MTKTVYYRPGHTDSRLYFRDGLACWVDRDPNRPWDEDHGSLPIWPLLYQALFQLGIVDQLAELPHDFILGAHEEGVIFREGLETAVRDLRARAASLEVDYDWLCLTDRRDGEVIEYRLAAAGSAVRRGLEELAGFAEDGARRGFDLQLWL